MNDIKKDLQMTSPQKNIKNLKCQGCRNVTENLYTLKVDRKIIFMCGDCKESLSDHLENEDLNITMSIYRENEKINSNKRDTSYEYSLYDTAQYVNDHRDC